MRGVRAIAVPEDSLLAGFGGSEDYRDAFCREVPGAVSLEQFIERFYCSMVFWPERLVLSLIGRGASSADARALARGEVDRIAVWEVVERTDTAILLESKDTGTASWLAVEATTAGTNLLFGSWVGSLNDSGWKFMLHPHQWYSYVLLGGY
ncbi:hypothetical protein [Aurantiacibacter gilvus]|uniref:Uncharacterized protein n=1 Tax=Aurantiacibacter gilvus TaxID=3139141 RepID=A0ABU9II24_9SPHN